MSLVFLPMRRFFSILAAGTAVVAASSASAADRLIDACEVAVNVHAEDVHLQFRNANRTGRSVALTIEFETEGNLYAGKANCLFRETSEDEPPSLERIEAMGQSNAGMFLMSHHAVWQHFTGGQQEAWMPELKFEKEPEKERPRRRPVIAAR